MRSNLLVVVVFVPYWVRSVMPVRRSRPSYAYDVDRPSACVDPTVHDVLLTWGAASSPNRDSGSGDS